MNNWRVAAAVAVVAALGASAAVAARGRTLPVPSRPWDVAAERTQRDADIAWYIARARRDPTGATDHLRLAALYLQRARERGAPADLELAEREARTSLANRREHNQEAFRALALALIGQHRFVEAADAADSLLDWEPGNPGARSLRGEIALELGDYARADAIFLPLDRPGHDPATTSRVARWAAIRGRSAHARALLLSARDSARARTGTPAEQVAWFELRLGELALAAGEYRAAAQSLTAATAIVPDDPRILLAQARLALATGSPGKALDRAEAAMNVGEDPLAFAIASDALRQLGRAEESERMFLAFETAIAAAPPSAWHRQWRLALLDRRRRIGEVLEQAEVELGTRRDVYGWDLYAWALHQAGRQIEARVAMRRALAVGTEDQLLARHANAIGVAQ